MNADEIVTLPLEVREVDEPARVATMVVCRYGEESPHTSPRERFAPGAFTTSVTARGDRIPFTDRHTDGTGTLKAPPVARPVRWDTADPVELRAVVKFFDTPEGWAAFCRARDGELDSGSVGFKAIAERAAGKVREVTEAVLHHVALLSRAELAARGRVPAYAAPGVVEVRDVAALLAVSYDPGIADGCVTASDMSKLVHGG
jgi:phage head maturation protease